jgi:hypothetical protein
MPLRRFDLTYDKQQGDWVLRQSGASKATRRFASKEEGMRGGVLGAALGTEGGSVRIHKIDGTIQEERTFPGSADPKRSPG